MKILIIAEVGINQNSKLNRAYQLIDTAKRAGADVVKQK
jgi:sialic acid synthase SpsE